MAYAPESALQLQTDVLATFRPAHDVVADVGNAWRSRFEREEGVEACDAVNLGGRQGHSLADVVQRPLADEARAVVDCVEHRQEQMTPFSRFLSRPADL